MEKRISVISIFLIVLFLIAITAASTSFARSQQNEPLPKSQQPPPSKDVRVQRAQKPKSEFWDLEVDKVIINGQSLSYPRPSGPAPTIHVKVGEPVNCKCYYKIKTIPISDITGSDAKHWGSGNFSYRICAQIYEIPDFFSSVEWTCLNRKLPKFTYEDVKNWPLVSRKSRKTWTSYLEYNWIATAEYVGNNSLMFTFWVDDHDTIKETDEDNNGEAAYDRHVALIVVIP